MSVAQAILRSVRARGRGAVFTPKDFSRFGPRASIDQALSRLARDGSIRRVDRGIYTLPWVHPRLGPLAPGADAVVGALARQSGKPVQLTGAASANALHLSTQVFARAIWLTYGPNRSVMLGRLPIILQHVDPADAPCLGTVAGMAISALRYIGAGNIAPADVTRLKTGLRPDDKRRMYRVRNRLPDWLRDVVLQVGSA